MLVQFEKQVVRIVSQKDRVLARNYFHIQYEPPSLHTAVEWEAMLVSAVGRVWEVIQMVALA